MFLAINFRVWGFSLYSAGCVLWGLLGNNLWLGEFFGVGVVCWLGCLVLIVAGEFPDVGWISGGSLFLYFYGFFVVGHCSAVGHRCLDWELFWMVSSSAIFPSLLSFVVSVFWDMALPGGIYLFIYFLSYTLHFYFSCLLSCSSSILAGLFCSFLELRARFVQGTYASSSATLIVFIFSMWFFIISMLLGFSVSFLSSELRLLGFFLLLFVARLSSSEVEAPLSTV